MASDLTKEEQAAIRAAIRFLSIRFGKMALLAQALRFEVNTLQKVLGENKAASPVMAFRIARLAGTGVDDVLTGRWPVPGTCPHCGRGPG